MAIDPQKIISVYSAGELPRDKKGIMGIFGIYAAYNYNEFFYRIVSKALIQTSKEEAEKIENQLYQAVLECAYYTFHGARTSMSWREIVYPMIETPEDEVQALVAFTNVFGIGYLEVVELIPDNKLVTRVYNAYDPGRYLEEYGPQPHGRCYMFRACTASYMDLVYGPPFPNGIGTFKCEEVKCRSMGDKYCEFVATKAQEG